MPIGEYGSMNSHALSVGRTRVMRNELPDQGTRRGRIPTLNRC